MKIRITVLIIAIALIFASCSAPAAQTGGDKAGFGESDLVFVLDGAQYTLCSDAEPLLAALGDGYKLASSESCVYTGDDKWFYYPDEEETVVMVATNPIDDKDVFFQIDIYGGDYATSKGIKIGSSLGDVKAAYGDGFYEKDGLCIYSLSGDENDLKSRQLGFEFDDQGKVALISYYDPSTNIK